MKKKKADRYRRAQGRKIREEGKREGWREIGKKVKQKLQRREGGGGTWVGIVPMSRIRVWIVRNM